MGDLIIAITNKTDLPRSSLAAIKADLQAFLTLHPELQVARASFKEENVTA